MRVGFGRRPRMLAFRYPWGFICDQIERTPVRDARRFLAGERLPTTNRDIDIGRIKLQPETNLTGGLALRPLAAF